MSPLLTPKRGVGAASEAQPGPRLSERLSILQQNLKSESIKAEANASELFRRAQIDLKRLLNVEHQQLKGNMAAMSAQLEAHYLAQRRRITRLTSWAGLTTLLVPLVAGLILIAIDLIIGMALRADIQALRQIRVELRTAEVELNGINSRMPRTIEYQGQTYIRVSPDRLRFVGEAGEFARVQ